MHPKFLKVVLNID